MPEKSGDFPYIQEYHVSWNYAGVYFFKRKAEFVTTITYALDIHMELAAARQKTWMEKSENGILI